jgi:hypothetical protein
MIVLSRDIECAAGFRDDSSHDTLQSKLDRICTRESQFKTEADSLAAYKERVSSGQEAPRLLDGQSVKEHLESLKTQS